MRLALALAALLAGCSGSADQTSAPPAREPPAFLEQRFDDGTISLRYPTGWYRDRSDTFGVVLGDSQGRHPAFVSIRYVEPAGVRFAELAARTIRPPDGRGLTLLYTQSAILGGRRAREATFMWQTQSDTPIGPLFRVFGVPLGERIAVVVFAAERPPVHNGAFRWIRETLTWRSPALRRSGGRYSIE